MNTRITRFLFGATIALAIALLLIVLPMPTPTRAAPAIWAGITVSTTADEYGTGTDCSLREAVKTQNDNANFGGCVRGFDPGPGTDKIFLPSGTYTLTRAGAGEDLDATGDLDIRASVIVSATGATAPTVAGDPNWTDRIFHVLTGTVTIKGIAISGGWVSSGGGGAVRIESGASLSLNATVVANSFSIAVNGGGIYNSGTLILTHVTLSGNSATGGFDGGGIYNNSGDLTLTDVTLSGNSATGGSGGGIRNFFGTNTLTNVTLSSNTAFWFGGGIDNSGTASTLTNVTLSGNSARSGGGIHNNNGGSTLTLTNVTLSGNSATGGFSGAGGGIYNESGTVAIKNTIVANSPAGGNCSNFSGGSFSLSSDGTCGFGASRDNVAVMLGPLANNGGSTLTHLPLPGSPAIDFGTNAGCPATDQRGASRPIGKACDVGAVETGYLFLPLILR